VRHGALQAIELYCRQYPVALLARRRAGRLGGRLSGRPLTASAACKPGDFFHRTRCLPRH